MIGQQLLSLLYGDPADQIARAVNPSPAPNPNPGQPPPVSGQGGAPGGGGPPPTTAGGGPLSPQQMQQLQQAESPPSGSPSSGPMQPQPPMAPANATQSPPDLASLYLKLHQQDVAANQIDRGTALMASAFGTQQQQHDMMNYAMSQPMDNRVQVVNQAIDAQKALTAQQEHARFMAGSALAAKVLNVDQPTAAWMMNDPKTYDDAMATHFANVTKTELGKNLDDAVNAQALANPNMTPQDLAAYRNQMLSYAVNPAMKEAATTQAKQSQEFKDTATQDYSALNSRYTQTNGIIDQLLKNPDSVVNALTDITPTSGQWAAWNPLMSQDTKNTQVLIDRLKSTLSADALKDVKNVRNQKEFNALSSAATGALSAGNSRDQIVQYLTDLKNKTLDAQAAAEAAAGHHLSGDLANRPATQDLLSPTLNGKPNPYYNGATQDAKPQQGQGGGKTYTYNPKTGQLE